MKSEKNASFMSPSQDQLNSLIDHYQNRRFNDAEKLALFITKKFPEYPFGWKVLGAVLKQTGRISDSLAPMQKSVDLEPQDSEAYNNLGVVLHELGSLFQASENFTKAIELKPNYAEAHNNLGNTLRELGKLEKAEISSREAILLKPYYAQPYNNLGIILKELGRFKEAEANYIKAIKIKPDYAEAYYNLGNTLTDLKRLKQAEENYIKAIDLKPNYAEAYNNLGSTLKEMGRLEEAYLAYIQAINFKADFTEVYLNVSLLIKKLKYNAFNPQFYPILKKILMSGNLIRPLEVAGSILSLLKLDPLIKDFLSNNKTHLSWIDAELRIEAIDKLKLLHCLMRLSPLPDLQIEKLFVAMRRFHLINLDKIQASPKLIYFLSSLSLHCFTNEYIYFESEEETKLVKALEDKISQTLVESDQPEIMMILCLASYRHLHKYDWCQNLDIIDHLEEVKTRLIEEPLFEKLILQDIPVLKKISNELSIKVREQYEENPYPRWIKAAISIKAKSIAEVCDEVEMHLNSESIKDITAPKLLIAGCGTGQNSVETASRFSNCQVTAVDLSLSSLAYAQRKTNELGISNIKYFQADILDLCQIDKKFDIIESLGVLHHMDKPMVGWRELTQLLHHGGLMKLGLYSELAREQVVKAKEKIRSFGIKTSRAEIRNFRQSQIVHKTKDLQILTSLIDFYSLSEYRDLLFHVKEHHFNLLQIQDGLNKLGLKFCGFENKDITNSFKEFYTKGADVCNLELWHQFEESNPTTFLGMYQFWCQKI